MKVVRSSPLHTDRFYPQEYPGTLSLVAELTPGHMLSSVATGKKFPVTPLGIDPETLRLAAQCYATPGPLYSAANVNLTTHVCLVSRIRVCVVVTPIAIHFHGQVLN